MITSVFEGRGRIVHCMWAKRPGGETSRERIVQGANRPGGETSWWRTVQRAKRPRLGAKRQSGETSCYRLYWLYSSH